MLSHSIIATSSYGLPKYSSDTQCEQCHSQAFCWVKTKGLEATLKPIVRPLEPFQKNAKIYAQGARVQSAYIVRSGSIKVSHCSVDGAEQIAGFYFSGQLLGFDGIASRQAQYTATALEEASVCEIPFHLLDSLLFSQAQPRHYFMRLISRDIIKTQKKRALLKQYSAQQRFVSFLLDLFAHVACRQLSATSLVLSMTREEMGNYLGLTLDTVNRLFGQFQQRGVIHVTQQNIKICDFSRLASFLA